MKLRYIQEPSLQFGKGQHLCPKSGIFSYNPYDLDQVRPDKITIGIIGKSESTDIVLEWLNSCKRHIDGKSGKNGSVPHPNLFLNFCGFNKEVGFKSEIVYDDGYVRKINNSEFEEIVNSDMDFESRITSIADLYLAEIKFLTKNKRPDVILCVLSDNFFNLVQGKDLEPEDEEEKNDFKESAIDEVIVKKEQNFRRYLKAKAMQYNVPIQMLRDKIANPSSGMQDPATIAWNFFTAIYYKASGTPWALIRKDISDSTCYAGISFYKSRDSKTTQTSIAQIFNEIGKGVILRGEEVIINKYDRTPHMNEEQAFNLLSISLKEYFEAVKIYPRRLVVHKTSNFSPDEIYGFKQAAKQVNIYQIDLVTIMPSKLRLYRSGEYPPLRGTQVSLSEKRLLLYTRGSVPYFETYAGMYIPSPIEIRLFEHDESPNVICDEILALTKMNWNNTQFDRKFPITLECARNVGEILKYLEPEDVMQLKYSFYM
ncbi:hypothetical protein MTsPCn9_06310 [Croceitalea sp. MTPC9]|uniref:argonaute/piwi family protein n=1 Tax=unclassified Croceitalea TaxID=2632280 RepID=UPI002B3A58A8|nr:hypothetical protein MTsPCn6_02400 [Croceitalea sp. MTPC6]GMN15695.1 hypothetical protein MTsPCn9_06310 [Croceitalea sp. MTPC9]